jgi:putative transposase
MSRVARIVVPGVPHHVTQRGNRRMPTFFGPTDYARYLALVATCCAEARVATWAWCLMPNHVHLVLVPETVDGLARAMSSVHQKYSWVVNREQGWQGHLWQSRFYSCPLDDTHVQSAVRYVEFNPVRAQLVRTPEQWRWSSAQGHITGDGDKLVRRDRPPALRDVGDWAAFLAEGLSVEEADALRLHQVSGRALGSPAFVERLETVLGQKLRAKPRGRPRRKNWAENRDAENRDSHPFPSQASRLGNDGAGNG